MLYAFCGFLLFLDIEFPELYSYLKGDQNGA
jgi:hypothetical protein